MSQKRGTECRGTVEWEERADLVLLSWSVWSTSNETFIPLNCYHPLPSLGNRDKVSPAVISPLSIKLLSKLTTLNLREDYIWTFRACIGVLLTNLTLESELRIKSHLQKLLTVAKNLFSHLGKIYSRTTNIDQDRQFNLSENVNYFLGPKIHELGDVMNGLFCRRCYGSS